MRKRSTSIASIVLGFPLFGVALSLATSHNAAQATTNNDGLGDGKAVIIFGAILYGILGLVASLILGPLVARLTHKFNNRLLSLLGYTLPSLAAFLIVLWGFISVVIVGNPSPY
jgi:hypothetical protein